MDILLLGGAVGLSVSMLPACMMCQQHLHFHLREEQTKSLSPISISLGLSFCLFALSVLETMPSSWLLVLDNRIVETNNDDGSSGDTASNEYLTISYAYFVVLSSLSIYILVVCPCMVGSLLMERMIFRPDCNLLCFLPKEKPWWLKALFGMISLVIYFISILLKTILLFLAQVYRMIQGIWSLIFRRRHSSGLSKRDSNNGGMTLPLTKKIDAESSGSLHSNMNSSSPRSSYRYSLGCLMRSAYELLLLKGGTYLMGCLLGVTSTVAILHSIAPFIIEPKSYGNNLALALSWMSAIGIVVSACLNGFGSVSMPHSCLAGLYLDPIKAETVTKATIDLQKTQDSLQARREQLKDRGVNRVSPGATSSSSANAKTANSFSRWALIGTKRSVKPTFSELGEDIQQRKKKILQEISFLEALVEEMKEDIDDMRFSQQMEAASRTTLGRVKSWLGVVFSVILLARLYFAAVSIWHHWYSNVDAVVGTTTGPSPKRDPVTTALLWMLGHHMVTEKEYDELSQFISLLLTAMLSFSQVRTFLRTAAAMHRRLNQLFCPARIISGRLTPRNNDASSGAAAAEESVTFQTRTGVYIHLLAALMGSYFLACIVLTKAMLPWQYRSSFSSALGGFDAFVINTFVINAMFAVAAVGSATILAMLFGIQKQNALRHNVSWLDDLGGQGRDLDV